MGRKRLRILFIDHGTGLRTLADYQTRAQGGRVSSLLRIPDALSQIGHDVFVASDIEQSGTTPAGTHWYQRGSTLPARWDVVVSNRAAYDGFPQLAAARRVLWTHDLPHVGFIEDPTVMRHYALTVFMSRYAEWVWRIHFPTIGKSANIPNGVDRDLYHPREKEPEYIIYVSNPNRGLHRLGSIAESVNGKLGHRLKWVAFSNHKILHPTEGDAPATDGSMDNFGSAADLLGLTEQGVEVKHPVPQAQLAEKLGSAGLMVLPTAYPEICSNAVLQALASGVPIVTGNYGSSPEWIRSGWNGHLTKTHLHDYMVYLVEIARATWQIISDRRGHQRMIRNAARTPGIYTWRQIGEQWDKALRRLF
jgi:glycosyltransferase involved in cell wall biosynthesis